MPDPKVTWKVSVDKDGAIKSFSSVEQAIAKMAKEQKDALGQMRDGWTKANSAIEIVRKAIGYIQDGIALFNEQVKKVNMAAAFEATTQGAQELIATLQEKTDGTISVSGLQGIVSSMGTVKDAANDLAKAAPAALKLAAATGKDADEVLKELAKSAKTLNTTFLEEAGITVDVDLAMKAYAVTLGKTADELTKAEKASALLQAEQEAINSALKGFDPTPQLTGLAQLSAAWDDFTLSMGKAGVLLNEIQQAGGELAWLQKKKGEVKAQVELIYEQAIQAAEDKKAKEAFANAGFTMGPEAPTPTKGSTLALGITGETNKAEQDKALAAKKAADDAAKQAAVQAKSAAQAAFQAEQAERDKVEAYRESLREAERQKAFDMADEATQLQMDQLAAEREYLQAKLQMEADALAESEAIKAAEIAAIQAERDAYLELADSMGAAIAAITGSKKVEAAAIAAVAGVKAGFEVAESLASFATGNIPAGVAHAAAAVQYGVTAGTNIAKVFETVPPKKEEEPPADLKAQSQGGRASMTAMGTSSGGKSQSITIVFQGDVVGPSGDKKWLIDGINKGIRQGQRISEKGIGKVGVDI